MQNLKPGQIVEGFQYTGGDPYQDSSWTKAPPRPGDEIEGFVFKGGDPYKDESWLRADKPRGAFGVANDTVIEAANAAAGGVKAISDFISPGNKVSQAIGDFIKFGEQSQSDAVQAEKLRFQRELADAVDAGAEIGTVLEYIASNPLISAAQAVGSFAVPGGAIKGAGALAKGLSLTDDAAKLAGRSAAAGTAAGVLTGAAMGGGDAAGNAFELVMQTPNEVLSSQPEFSELVQGGLSVDQAKQELANKAARKASVLPAIVGGAFGALGLEKLVAGGGGYTGSVAARALKGFASEGIQEAFEEGLTTASGQKAASEYNPEIDPYQGVAGAAAMGGALGGVLGGTAGAFTQRSNPQVSEEQRLQAQAALDSASTADDALAAANALADVPIAVPAIKTPFQIPSIDPSVIDERLQLASSQAPTGFRLDPIAEQLTAAAEVGRNRLPNPVAQKIDQIKQAIESRGGVATEIEADFLQRYNAGQPFDRIATNEELGVVVSPKRQVITSDVIQVEQSGARRESGFPQDIQGEWVAFPPESGTLNIPRAEMPQVKAENRGPMVNFLNARGVDQKQEDVDPDSLKPTQAEFSLEKVKKAKEFQGGDRSILVSSDGYILDGHHQWLAKKDMGELVKTIRLNAPIKELLPLVREFPSSTLDTSSEIAMDLQSVNQPTPTLDTLQNRDRTRAASVIQMGDIASNPDYPRLGPSKSPDFGAPMVFAVADDLRRIPVANYGKEDFSVMADGQRVPFRYAVVDASQVNPSNFVDGTVNPEFGSKQSGVLKALNNGRVAGLRAAYEKGTAGRYQDELIEDVVNLGIDRGIVEQLDQPILIRVYSENDNQGNMAAKSQGQGLGMSVGELARQDAPLFDSGLLSDFQAGDVSAAVNRDFVLGFVGKLQESGQDVAGMLTDRGALSPAGRQRIQAALMQSAYDDSDLVQELFESIDTDIKSIGEALKTVAGQWANMRDSVRAGNILPQADITVNLMQAVRLIQRSRRDKIGLGDLTRQVDIESGKAVDVLTQGVLQIFYPGVDMNRAAGRDRMVDALRTYIGAAMSTSAGPDLFGEQVSTNQLVNAALSQENSQDEQAVRSTETQEQSIGSSDFGQGVENEPGRPEQAGPTGSESIGNDRQIQPTGDRARDTEGDPKGSDLPSVEPLSQDQSGAQFIGDFGEKIGGARKDTAQSLGAKGKSSSTATTGGDDTPSWRKRFTVIQNVLNGKYLVMDTKTNKAMREGWRTLEFDSEQAAENMVPMAAVAQKHRVSYDGPADAPNYKIVRDITDRKRVTIKDGFASREEAMKYMAENAAQILEVKTGFGEEILAKPESVMRKGEPRREGDVKPQDFLDRFGFRGVEFGNWNNQEERQEVMNHAYDGLLDLAELLNVPSKALSLNGDLALAFGARGQGLSGARAHYERSYGVINLTKMSGAGSLAHEWWHAIDHYLGRQDGKASSKKVKNERGDQVFAAKGRPDDYASYGFSRAGQVREELRDAYQALIKTMFTKAEQYVEDTARAEKFVGDSRNQLDEKLGEIRKVLAAQLDPKYYKRNNKPATQEQLAAFDVLADKLLNGEDLDVEFRQSESKNASQFTGRYSNDTIDAIGAIYKSVRGRSGFNAERKGTLDSLANNLRRYKDRLELLESARKSDTKTKRVPTGYVMNARAIDEGRASDYWSTPHEMAARAFSSYVEDKLSEKGASSQFLSFGSNNNMPEYRLFNVRPFPEGTERVEINKAFDSFVSTVKTKSTDTGVAMFSRNQSSEPGYTTVGQIESLVKDLTKGWANKPEVIVADSMRDEKIPMEVRIYDVQQKMKGATGDPRGFFHRGKVYLISSDINSEKDVAEVLFHEALGHYGLRGVFGDSLNIVLDEVTLARPSMVADKARQYGLDVKKPNERRIAAEEVLAELAQTKPELGFVKRAVAAIRAWLRANVPGFKDLAVSDSEIIQNYILPARGWVENAEFSAEPDMAPAFSRSAMKDIDANIRRGQEALAKALTEKTSVNRAMFRNGLGWVDFVWGSEGKVRPNGKTKGAMGIAHIFEARARKDGMSEPETISLLDRMVKTIAAGEEIYRKAEDRSQMVSIRMNGSTVWLAKADGSNAWTVTAYDDKGAGGTQVRNGPDIDTLLPTQSNPTLPRARLGAGSLASDATPPSLTGAIRRDSTERGSPTGAESNSNITDDNNLVNKGDLTSELSIKSPATKNATENNQTVLLNVQNDGEGSKFPRAGNESQVDNDEPLFSRNNARVEGFKTPSESKLDNIIYKLQDKNVDLKRVTQAIKEKVGELDDVVNAYQKEELYHGRAAKQSQDFLNKQLKPLLDEMRMRKVSLQEFEGYLWNRHAQERNEQIAKVNDRFPDGGSGIKTEDARRYLAGIPTEKRSAYEALAKRVDQITRDNMQMMVDSGLETQDTVDSMRGAYKYYVPLLRHESASYDGRGSGYSIKGATTRRALGSDKPVENILSALADQREKIISRAEKARVGRALMGLALDNPQDDFWFVFDPLLNKSEEQRVELRNQLESVGLDPDLADEVSKQPYEEYMGTNGKVARRPSRTLQQIPNALAVRIDGQDKYIVLNSDNPRAKRMAEALTNLDSPQLEGALSVVAKASRFFASINTQYNPVFGVVNLIRDTQGALVNLSSTKIPGQQAKVTSGILPAIKAIYSVTRARRSGGIVDGEWADLYERFQNLGGQTGFRDMFESPKERTKKQIMTALEPGAVQNVLSKTATPVLDWLSDYNETLENAVRLSAFKAALDQGLTEEQAASTAKNLTVNFNRKGQVGTQAGAFYAFYNASTQGSARLLEALTGPAGKKIVAGGVLAGAVQTLILSMAGYDDEEPPEFVRERNLVIPTSDGKYVTVPMPLGLHILPNIGRIVTEQMMGRTQKSAPESLANLFLTVAGSFNPVGSSTFLQTISPTVLDPAVALSENRDFTGRPIAKEDQNPNKPTPGYTRTKDNTIEMLIPVSRALNYLTGGSDFRKGLLSPTPDQLEYLVGQFTGGVGRELSKVVQTAETSITGEELPTYKVPLLGRFYGDTQGQSSESGQFYENLRAMSDHKLEIKGRAEEGIEYASYVKENPEAMLFNRAEDVERTVSELRRRKRLLKEKGAGPETIKQIDAAITRNMAAFNEQVGKARGRVKSE